MRPLNGGFTYLTPASIVSVCPQKMQWWSVGSGYAPHCGQRPNHFGLSFPHSAQKNGPPAERAFAAASFRVTDPPGAPSQKSPIRR